MSVTRNRAGVRMGDTLAGTGPAPSTVALFGASITWWNGPCGLYDDPLAIPYSTCQGYWTWADASLGGRLQLLRVAGYPGERSDQLLARISEITDLPVLPGFAVMVDIASNDALQSIPSATTIGNLTQAFDALRDLGIVNVVSTVPPIWSATAAVWQAQSEVSQWVREQASQPGFIIADVHGRWADGTSGGARTGLTYDGVHPTTIGAAALGKVIADAMRPYVAGSTVNLIGMNQDTTNKLLNGMQVGTAGTVGTGAAGTFATNWTATRLAGAGTVTGSKVARTDNIDGAWQQLAIGSGTFVYLQNITIAGLAVGQTYQAEMEFSSLVGANLKRFILSTAVIGGSNGSYAMNQSAGSTLDEPSEITAGVIRGPVFTVDGTPTGIQVAVTLEGTGGSVRVSRFRLRRIT